MSSAAPPIDVVTTSIGRLPLLQRQLASLDRHLKYSGELRLILHEDEWGRNPQLSQDLVTWARASGRYFKIIFIQPAQGQGFALHRLYNTATTEWVFQMEDDHELVRDVDLDAMLKVAKAGHPQGYPINQIRLSRREIAGEKNPGLPGAFKKKMVDISGVPITTSDKWMMLPALSRRRFLLERTTPCAKDFHFHVSEILLLRKDPRNLGRVCAPVVRDADWVMANVGTYIWGKIGDPPHCLHLGNPELGGAGVERRTAK